MFRRRGDPSRPSRVSSGRTALPARMRVSSGWVAPTCNGNHPREQAEFAGVVARLEALRGRMSEAGRQALC
jgi:hypothetical protein